MNPSSIAPGAVCALVADQTLHLLPQRAVFWEEAAALLVADLHLGKAASFRAAGIPVPAGTTQSGLERLDSALAVTRATRMIILGDLLHARTGRAPGTLAAFAAWRARHARLALTLVRGNHDRHAGPAPLDWRIEEHAAPLREGPFLLRHEPGVVPSDVYVLAGHVHPCVRLHGPGAEGMRAPCFILGPRAGLLPAFGAFTGHARIRPAPDDRVFVIGPDAVVEVGGDERAAR